MDASKNNFRPTSAIRCGNMLAKDEAISTGGGEYGIIGARGVEEGKESVDVSKNNFRPASAIRCGNIKGFITC